MASSPPALHPHASPSPVHPVNPCTPHNLEPAGYGARRSGAQRRRASQVHQQAYHLSLNWAKFHRSVDRRAPVPESCHSDERWRGMLAVLGAGRWPWTSVRRQVGGLRSRGGRGREGRVGGGGVDGGCWSRFRTLPRQRCGLAPFHWQMVCVPAQCNHGIVSNAVHRTGRLTAQAVLSCTPHE